MLSDFIFIISHLRKQPTASCHILFIKTTQNRQTVFQCKSLFSSAVTCVLALSPTSCNTEWKDICKVKSNLTYTSLNICPSAELFQSAEHVQHHFRASQRNQWASYRQWFSPTVSSPSAKSPVSSSSPRFHHEPIFLVPARLSFGAWWSRSRT